MERIINAVWIFGKITLCVPADSLIPVEWKLSKIFRFLTLLVIVVHTYFFLEGIVLFLDVLTNNPREYVTGSPRFSEQLGFFLQYGAVEGTDFAIRLASLLCFRDLRILFSLCSQKRDMGVQTRNTLRIVWTIISMFVVIFLVSGYAYALTLVIVHFKISEGYAAVLIPTSEFGFRAYNFVNVVACTASTSFCWLFLITFSTHLTDWLDNYSARISGMEFKMKSEFMTKTSFLFANGQASGFREEFLLIRKGYESFGRIGGLYCLALLYQCTLLIIRFLGDVAFPIESYVAFQPGTQLFCYILPVGILLIVSLGGFMARGVSAFPVGR